MYKKINELITKEHDLSSKLEYAYESKEEVRKKLNNIMNKLDEEIDVIKKLKDEVHNELMKIVSNEADKEELSVENTDNSDIADLSAIDGI